MRRAGARVALQFRKHHEKAQEAPEEVEANRYRLEEGDGTTHAQRIVRELYFRYEKQLQRGRDYRDLFVFLGFVALFLAVLYLQRHADVSYKVHSTLEDVMVPGQKVMKSTSEVYDWLANTLDSVWVDPVCGDGICESPWEFASYSRFGCRADCGKLQDLPGMNLTRLQIDLYYDFAHPIGSIPASDLMQQASWNLCPVNTSYSSDCYYDTDQGFDRLSGSASFQINDAPDGAWNVVMKRDIFMKVDGAVRDVRQLYAIAYYYKVYIAAQSIISEHQFERDLLNAASRIGNMSYFEYVNETLHAMWPNNVTHAQRLYQQAINATCLCSFVPKVNGGNASTLWDTDAFLHLNQSRHQFQRGDNSAVRPVFNQSQYNVTQYGTEFCSDPTLMGTNYDAISKAEPGIFEGMWEFAVANASASNVSEWLQSVNSTKWCIDMNVTLTTWRLNMTQTMQRLLIDRRLGDQRTNGKLVLGRNAVFNALRSHIVNRQPELFDPVFTMPRGSLYIEPLLARIDVLQEFYATGPLFFNQPQPAAQQITRRTVYNNPNVTLVSLAARAEQRRYEVDVFEADLRANVQVPTSWSASYPNMTVGQVLNMFVNASATNVSTPLSTNVGLGVLRTNYNLVAWRGNNTAYLVANLKQRDQPKYQGTCLPMNNTCVVTANDTMPYNCSRIVNGAITTRIEGNITDNDYYVNCVVPCDRMLDCHNSTICECYGACGPLEFCHCAACQDLGLNAAMDKEFQEITGSLQNKTQLALIPGLGSEPPFDVTDPNAATPSGRRRLQQTPPTDVSSQLSAVLTQIGSVKTKQDDIATQMQRLQNQVDQANRLAEQRANDMRLLDMISAGRMDIRAGQARVEGMLNEIIGKQNQALATAEQAARALDAIQGLAQKQVAAQQALERAVANQLAAIKTAAFQSIITITQALALWKRSRRDRALTMKAATLANIPCISTPSVSYNFTLDNGNTVDLFTPRERNVGLTNRVIAGMLLHQHRTNDTNCTESKFSKIQQTCTGPTTLKSYGVDPVFKRGTLLYEPNFDDIEHQIVRRFYNCELLESPTYNITFQNVTVNPFPYCAELYNAQQLPYAFHHFPLKGKTPGFPVFLDINLGSDDARKWRQYLEQGLYLDMHTRAMTAELVTYNAPLRIFGYFFIEFYFHEGGSIKVTHRLHTVRVELYASEEDDVRFAFEIILSICICSMLLFTFWKIIMVQKDERNFLKFFLKGWNIVEFISNGLLFSCIVIWWIIVEEYAKSYDILLRYDVYDSLTPDANFLALADEDGKSLTQAWDDIDELRELVDMLNWYFALNGINILLLIARVLKLMDFQPRLGVVTRSLWLAGPDLIHFAIVAGMVFVGYAMMAHLIFGNAIEEFATFGDSVNTCFEILLGNIDVNEELRELGGLQSVAGALFFWSYVLLVYMVLLNFLLAIIVDAFSEVKEKTSETVGIHTELYQLMRDKWRSLMGRCSKNYISDAKLGQLLKQWAGEEDHDKKAKHDEVEMQKLLTVLNEDLDEEDLRNILTECLKDAPGAGDDEKAATRRGLLALCLPNKKSVQATPTEVALAAKYIVDRFGVPVEAEEAMEAEEAEGGAPERSAMQDAALEKERDQLAAALERLAEVQRELAEGQRNLMVGQKQLAEQQAKLVTLMASDPGRDD